MRGEICARMNVGSGSVRPRVASSIIPMPSRTPAPHQTAGRQPGRDVGPRPVAKRPAVRRFTAPAAIAMPFEAEPVVAPSMPGTGECPSLPLREVTAAVKR